MLLWSSCITPFGCRCFHCSMKLFQHEDIDERCDRSNGYLLNTSTLTKENVESVNFQHTTAEPVQFAELSCSSFWNIVCMSFVALLHMTKGTKLWRACNLGNRDVLAHYILGVSKWKIHLTVPENMYTLQVCNARVEAAINKGVYFWHLLPNTETVMWGWKRLTFCTSK